MAEIPKQGTRGAPLPFSLDTKFPTTITAEMLASKPLNNKVTIDADVRLRSRFDMEKVEVPRAPLSSMIFFERRRRSEYDEGQLIEMRRIRDDPTIVQNKPFPHYPVSHRLPIQCTRLACIPKDLPPAQPKIGIPSLSQVPPFLVAKK